MLIGCASNKSADCCDPSPPQAVSCSPAQPDGAAQPVTVVNSLEPIKAAFNAYADKPRIVLLVSPVCSECVLGAEAVRKSIMDKFAASGVQAIVVWEPMLDPDNEDAARNSSGIFAGVPATQFYDPDRKAGWAYEREQFSHKWDEVAAALPADHWLRKAHDRKPDPGPEWDIYMLYKPGVRWSDKTPRPDAFIRHIGRDENGQSRYFRDGFKSAPASGDLFQAMETMGRDVLGKSQAMNIELLGFPGCPNTLAMRDCLIAAIKTLGGELAFQEVNQESLPESDIRRGWPAPTVLLNGQDLFGSARPSSPAMGCRMYAGGVPDSVSIENRWRSFQSSADRTRR